MVKGIAALHRRFEKVPVLVKSELEKQIAKEAAKLVAEMKQLAPVDGGDLRDSIGWTWGDAPKASLSIGKAYGDDYGKVVATIYVGAFYARFQEFGTLIMPASPFFYPILRANKTRIRANLTRAVRRAMKKA